MNLVVDTSAIIAVLTNESDKEQIIRITQDAMLFAPASLHWEIGNAFSAMYKRGRINLQQSLEAIELYRTIPIQFIDVDLAAALALAHRFGIYAYDAYFMECAVECDATLLTLDEGLNRVARATGLTVQELMP